MSDESKSEIIIDVENPDKGSEEKTSNQPLKKLSFQTKFFFAVFAILLTYHFFSSWSSNSEISALNEKNREANKKISDLELKNQKLDLAVKEFTNTLKEAKSNLKYVESDRQDRIDEIKELIARIEAYKKDLNEGSKLEIVHLEKKLAQWEKYQKNIEALLKTRPSGNN